MQKICEVSIINVRLPIHEAIINGSTPAPIFNQFIFTEYGIRTSLFLEIPLNLSLEDIEFSDTSDFNYEAFDPKRQVQDGVLKVLADNYFPFNADLILLMLDGNDQIIDSLVSTDQILAPALGLDGRPTETKTVFLRVYRMLSCCGGIDHLGSKTLR